MQVSRIVQAVVLMLIVALAASCAATKEYSSKLFKPHDEAVKDSQALALRFLELDKLDGDKADWVTTDIIMGRDTNTGTAALDNLAKTFPVKNAMKDSAASVKEEKTNPVDAETKPAPLTIDAKPQPVVEQPVAKNYDPTVIRSKKTRVEKLP